MYIYANRITTIWFMKFNEQWILYWFRYSLHFRVPELHSLILRSGLQLKLLFLQYRTHQLYINILIIHILLLTLLIT
jgi:hypothetical protein